MYKANTDGFRWLPSYYEALRNLPNKDRLALYDALLDYGFGNEPEELPPRLHAYFALIVPTMEASVNFERKQRENGRKGGRPKKTQTGENEPGEKPNTEKTENPNKTQTKPNTEKTKNLDIDVDIDIDIESDIDVDNKRTGFSMAVAEYAKKISLTPSPASMRELAEYEKEIGYDVCSLAMDAALDAGARNWNYVKAILNNCAQNGITSKEAWNQQQESRKSEGRKNHGTGWPGKSWEHTEQDYHIEPAVKA